MYCKYCGRELSQGSRYCPACGAEQTVNEDPFTIGETSEIVEKKPARVWSILSKVGWIISIVAIATSWIPFLLGFELGIPGIVLCCLGRKAKTDVAYRHFRIGLIMSIVAMVVSIISYIIFVVVYGIALGELMSGYYY
ncbi:MAG: zinc-ribbon domain-containing protein [Clostridiales bacterium]|nr:zinc-ribbon domain-containing protein [Clostridiales bacterium]